MRQCRLRDLARWPDCLRKSRELDWQPRASHQRTWSARATRVFDSPGMHYRPAMANVADVFGPDTIGAGGGTVASGAHGVSRSWQGVPPGWERDSDHIGRNRVPAPSPLAIRRNPRRMSTPYWAVGGCIAGSKALPFVACPDMRELEQGQRIGGQIVDVVRYLFEGPS